MIFKRLLEDMVVRSCTRFHGKPFERLRVITLPVEVNLIPDVIFWIMYQLIPSLTIPRAFARSHCPGVQVFAQFSLPGGRGFELVKFVTVLREKCMNFSNCFQESGGSLESRYYCAVLY